jgi:hypothetical protein
MKDRYEDRARAIAADHAAKNSTSSPVVVAQYPASNIPSPGATDVRSQSPNMMSTQQGSLFQLPTSHCRLCLLSCAVSLLYDCVVYFSSMLLVRFAVIP